MPRWQWQAEASLAMRLLTAVAGVVEAAGALAAAVVAEWEAAVVAEWEAAVAMAVADLAAVV